MKSTNNPSTIFDNLSEDMLDSILPKAPEIDPEIPISQTLYIAFCVINNIGCTLVSHDIHEIEQSTEYAQEAIVVKIPGQIIGYKTEREQ